MDIGHFYYVKDKYFQDFSNDNLMKNKKTVNGISHNRPCFCAFKDTKNSIYWMIPISSKINKYRNLYNNKVRKYGFCNTIVFANVLGHEKAFLIQNMYPVTKKYIKNEYLDLNGNPVMLDNKNERKIIKMAKKVLAKHRYGFELIFSDVIKIEHSLIEDKDMVCS